MTIRNPLGMWPMPARRASRAAGSKLLCGVAASSALFAAGWVSDAQAEHADRTKQMSVTATEAVADQGRHSADFQGNVVVSQGTLQILADRLQIRAGSNGERLGVAFGKAGAPVQFRQRGDKPDEWNEGQADRVEYDSGANQVRLIGSASLRNLSGTVVTQSVSSAAITYDTALDTISSTQRDQGGAPEANARQRVTVVFAPRATPSADPASATAAPASP